MRIISKFRDYYDSAQGFGQDQALIYRREAKHMHFEHWPGDKRIKAALNLRPDKHGFDTHLTVLGFCGRIYPLWLSSDFPLTPESATAQSNTTIVLTGDEVIESHPHGEAYYRDPNYVVEKMGHVFEELKAFEGMALSDDSFRAFGAPIFLAYDPEPNMYLRGDRLMGITNVRLASLDFMKRMDAFGAFQEIAMFLGSTLASDTSGPVTVGDDKVLTATKGFDEQSFRTAAPGTKKQNRKLNKARKRGGHE